MDAATALRRPRWIGTWDGGTKECNVARVRTVKPEFFTNEGLASCDPHARLLAIGLLQLADREGRLRWLPTQIHGNIFPFEPDVDVKHLGKQLVKQNFVHLYSVDGKDYAVIVNFRKHQRISGKEAETPSFIPPPPEVVVPQQVSPGSTVGSTGVLHQKPPETLIPLVLKPESSSSSKAKAASPEEGGEGDVDFSKEASQNPGSSQRAATAPVPPPVIQAEAETSKVALTKELRAEGLNEAAGAIDEALASGCHLSDIAALLSHYRSMSGAWGPGALQLRIRRALPGEDPTKNWPQVSEKFKRRHASSGNSPSPPILSAEQQRAKNKAETEAQAAKFGPVLDAMERDAAMSVLPKAIRTATGGAKWPLEGPARSMAIACLAERAKAKSEPSNSRTP